MSDKEEEKGERDGEHSGIGERGCTQGERRKKKVRCIVEQLLRRRLFIAGVIALCQWMHVSVTTGVPACCTPSLYFLSACLTEI